MARVAPDELEEQDEEAKVTAWRLKTLLDVGCPLPQAELLAISHQADLHTIVRALGQGCDPRLAVRIFFD